MPGVSILYALATDCLRPALKLFCESRTILLDFLNQTYIMSETKRTRDNTLTNKEINTMHSAHAQKYYDAIAADNAWSDELVKQFGKLASDYRYTMKGKGEINSVLRKLYDAKLSADKAWIAAQPENQPDYMPF